MPALARDKGRKYMSGALSVESAVTNVVSPRQTIDLRLLRYFTVVAEELHFARAAERLNVEQSPVSRAMRDLERLLSVQLFDKSRRQMRLTWAGQVLKGQSRNIFATVDRAVQATRSAAQGFHDFLRIAVSDSFAQPRISTLLARNREIEPEVAVRVLEMSYPEQISALQNEIVDVCLSLTGTVSESLTAEYLGTEGLFAVVSARHPLLARVELQLEDVLKFPLVLYQPDASAGFHEQLQVLLEGTGLILQIADYASSLGVLLTLIGAGYGVGFALASQVQSLQRQDIVVRPVVGRQVSTFAVRRRGELSEPLKRFLIRMKEEFADVFEKSEN